MVLARALEPFPRPVRTLDALFEEKNVKMVDPGHFIMEVKFNVYLPAWVKTVIASFGLKKGPASKYGLSIEALGLTKVRPWQSSLV